MKLIIISVLSILLAACTSSTKKQQTVRIGTNVLITFGSTGELLRVVFDHPEKEDFVIVEGTNITLCLNIAQDGAVYGIQTDWMHIDMITHIVEQETGVTNIYNPVAVVNGETSDIISAWGRLAQIDHRFTMNDERTELNQ